MLDTTDTDSLPHARAREATIDADRDRRTGRFGHGNRAWAARASSGPAPKFIDGDALWEACVTYFAWVEDHPLQAMQLITDQGQTMQVPVRRMRAMTIGGLCAAIGIAETTWRAWRDRPELAETVERAESVIREWNFTGAAAGLLDPALIARWLGRGGKIEGARTP
jgi:hypothetical protein